MNSETALAGKTILVTRPADQAASLSQLIRNVGGEPFVFPAIEIRPPADPAPVVAILERLQEFDLAIFVSPTAVARTFEYLGHRRWPDGLRAAAVGQGSARALHKHGLHDVIAPADRSDSEALLALPAMHEVAGKRIVIFRGEGGRELMSRTLTERGALVEHAECYRRTKPNADISPLLAEQQRQKFSAIVITSRESLANFREMAGEVWEAFKAIPVFVPHERIAQAAREMGMSAVHVTSGGDAGTVQAMIKFIQP